MFGGEFTKYYDFWARFNTAVHDNPSLTTTAKFTHLSSSPKGSAALVVQEYDITNHSNYHLAIEPPRRRPYAVHTRFLTPEIRRFACIVCFCFIAEGYVVPDPHLHTAAQSVRGRVNVAITLETHWQQISTRDSVGDEQDLASVRYNMENA